MSSTMVDVQLTVDQSEAWRWGYEDGLNGLSVYEGCAYFTFASRKWKEYEKGHKAGQQKAAHRALAAASVMPDDFAEALAAVEREGVRYCPTGIDWEAVEMEQWGS